MTDRYRVELSLNIWCDSDNKAKKIAEDICNEQKKRFDNRCQIINLYDSPFGRIKEREII
tara:strand:- start:837 stop:1016 length:180 start_codon:yes stop_codon:yes gene_type:complete